MLDALARDLRHAIRSIISRPTYALVTMVTLALVIGAASAVIAVVNATMIRPLRFPEGERLAQLFTMPPGHERRLAAKSPPPAHVPSLSHGGLRPSRRSRGSGCANVRSVETGNPRARRPGRSHPDCSSCLATVRLIGRTWTEAEDRANARVAVLSHGLWQRRFGGDSGVLGRTILIDREPHEIIAVMPATFTCRLRRERVLDAAQHP